MWAMSFVISFLNQKGGVGKSTLSINVAACFALLQQKVLLIDADKQGTSSTWASLREETDFQVVSLARENMARDALRLAAEYDFTIIDGPPQRRRSRAPALWRPISSWCRSNRGAHRAGRRT
jgi:cellulose biosynthesis protein BcsQ